MKQLVGRWCLLAIGIVVMALGIVIVTKSATGNTPISSTGYVLNVAYPSVSYGVFMFFWNIALLLGQVVILRKHFKALALLQIPISVLFSLSIDAFGHVLGWLIPANYALSLVTLAVGIVVLAAGVSCTVVANVAMNCGEALVAAITSKTGWNFGHTKVGFDVSCVVIACIVSLVTMGRIVGVREGTVAAAFVTGFVVNFFVRIMGGARPAIGTKHGKEQPGKKAAKASEKAPSACNAAAVNSATNA